MSLIEPILRTGKTLRPPEDGLQLTSKPQTDIGRAWLELLEGLPEQAALTQGRSLARAGRLRDLVVTPGMARAEVHDHDILDAALHVSPLSEPTWGVVVDLLGRNLHHLAELLEGELPASLVKALAGRGVSLLPSADQVQGECSCNNFAFPCAHLTATGILLADALDGDPFVLFELRGTSRDQLLTRIRRIWGDDRPAEPPGDRSSLEEVPDAPWFTGSSPDPALRFDLRPAPRAALGLRALGPGPGGRDLQTALTPLYEAGAARALDAALQDAELLGEVPEVAVWSEALVDLLDARDHATSEDLAARLGVEAERVLEELLTLESLGVVVRSGSRGEARWWLG